MQKYLENSSNSRRLVYCSCAEQTCSKQPLALWMRDSWVLTVSLRLVVSFLFEKNKDFICKYVFRFLFSQSCKPSHLCSDNLRKNKHTSLTSFIKLKGIKKLNSILNDSIVI